jgi:hypothetical protein
MTDTNALQIDGMSSAAQRQINHGLVQLRANFISRVPAVIVVIAAAVMSAALFLLFLQTPCGNCLRTATYTVQDGKDLIQAPNVWIAVALLILLAAAAIVHLAGIRPALTAVGCLALSVVAVAFPFVEAGDNGSLVFQGATAANPMTTEAGFYVFLVGATVAGLASLALLLTSFPRGEGKGPARVRVGS